jgi:foldase protein PrsA
VEVALSAIVIPDQKAIARVNGEEIATDDYRQELKSALHSVTAQYMVDWNDPKNTSMLPSFQDQVLDQMIERVLVRQLASQEGVAVDAEEIEDEMAALRDQIEQDPNIGTWDDFLAMNDLTEQAIQSQIADRMLMVALAENLGAAQATEHVHASHILVETEEVGQEVLDKLADGEDFGALAAEYSTDPGSKDQGGDLGWFPPGMMVPEFEAAAFSLEPGETSELVKSNFGYHIILVHGKEERDLDPRAYAQVQEQTFRAWFLPKKAEADIERLFLFQDPE